MPELVPGVARGPKGDILTLTDDSYRSNDNTA
jgi:hypothetical protein